MAKITDRALRTKPTNKHTWLTESMIWGHGSLVARITPSGARLFYFRYSNSENKMVRHPIGAYGTEGDLLTVAAAREKAMELAVLHQSGILDIKEHLEQQEYIAKAKHENELKRLQQEKEATESRLTVNQLFEHWLKVDLVHRADGGAEVERMFKKDVLPLIGNMFVADIKKGHITHITDTITSRGVTRMVKLVFSLIRQMFRFAVDRDIIEYDPTAGISKAKIGGKNVERDRVLTEDEIQMLSTKLTEANLLHTTQYAVWICLSTCCRIGELIKAKWAHIDFDKSEWLIPAENSKNGRQHIVHLSDFSKSQFTKLKQITGHSKFCYPNKNNDAHLNSKTITKQIGDRQKGEDQQSFSNRSKHVTALCLPHGKWTPHDLRRTGATLMASLGVLPEVAERCLNHIEENQMQRIYQRYSYQNEMRLAWTLLGDHINQLIQKPAHA